MTIESGKPRGTSRFNETHWSMVIAAGQKDSRAGEALQRLCRIYWHPLYAFVRPLAASIIHPNSVYVFGAGETEVLGCSGLMIAQLHRISAFKHPGRVRS